MGSLQRFSGISKPGTSRFHTHGTAEKVDHELNSGCNKRQVSYCNQQPEPIRKSAISLEATYLAEASYAHLHWIARTVARSVVQTATRMIAAPKRSLRGRTSPALRSGTLPCWRERPLLGTKPDGLSGLAI